MIRWTDRHPLMFLAALTLAMCAAAWLFFRTNDGGDVGVTPATVAPHVIFEETNEDD